MPDLFESVIYENHNTECRVIVMNVCNVAIYVQCAREVANDNCADVHKGVSWRSGEARSSHQIGFCGLGVPAFQKTTTMAGFASFAHLLIFSAYKKSPLGINLFWFGKEMAIMINNHTSGFTLSRRKNSLFHRIKIVLPQYFHNIIKWKARNEKQINMAEQNNMLCLSTVFL